MLEEIAIGDAYGAGFEYADAGFVRQRNDGMHYTQHPKWKSLKPGYYTDDAQMSLGVAEHMLTDEEWSRRAFAQRFVRTFNRDRRQGYARGFYDVLTSCSTGDQLLRRLQGHGDSNKSGGAMRAGVVGLYSSVDEVLEKSKIQASVTHNSSDGIAAAQASSLMVHYFAFGLGEKKDLGSFLERYVPGQWNTIWRGAVGSPGRESVRAAITALMQGTSQLDVLKRCIAFTGDVDTVAAIAMGPGSLCSELGADLPASLYAGLENGTYGRDYLRVRDKELVARFLGR